MEIDQPSGLLRTQQRGEVLVGGHFLVGVVRKGQVQRPEQVETVQVEGSPDEDPV
jgi:hypothetical protein